MNVEGFKTLKEPILLRNSNSLSNIATVIILLQATLTMGKSVSTIMNVKRSILKYGKFHIYTTPKLSFTRRNMIGKKIFDSYRTIWNTVLRAINRYVRKHTTLLQMPIKTPSIIPTSSVNFRVKPINQDATFVTDCTINHTALFETTLNKLKSNNFLKVFGNIKKLSDRRQFYAFDLKIDAPNLSRITRLNSNNNEKRRNASLLKHRGLVKVLCRPHHKRESFRIRKRTIHVKRPAIHPTVMPAKIPKTSLSKREKMIEEFSSIISDNSKNTIQMKCVTDLQINNKNVTEIKNSNHEIHEINMLTNLENNVMEQIVCDVKSSANVKSNKPSVTTIIRNNFAVHSYISHPISLLDIQENLLKSKHTNGAQVIERINKLDRNLYSSCVNLRPINNTLNIKRQLSNFSGSQTFIARKKTLNSKRFVSTITSKNIRSSQFKKSQTMDKHKFMTESQLRSNLSTMSDPSKLPYIDQQNNLNDYIKYNDSMLTASGNERQFLSLMSKIKNKINSNDEMEKSRLNAIAKQIEQIRNLKKGLNLYSDEDNFKTNVHYQAGEPKYELNCASSKFLKASSARIISKIQDEIKKESLMSPSSPPRRQSILRVPTTVNDNIGASRLIQELNTTASRMFQASLNNMHSVTYTTIQDNVGKYRFGGENVPTSSKSVLGEYNQSSPPPTRFNDAKKLFSMNNSVFPKKSIQFVKNENDRNHATTNTPKTIEMLTFDKKLASNENVISNQHSKVDPKKTTAQNVKNGMQYEQFYKNHLSTFDDVQANISKFTSLKFNQTPILDQKNDTTHQIVAPAVKSSVTSQNKSTTPIVGTNNVSSNNSEDNRNNFGTSMNTKSHNNFTSNNQFYDTYGKRKFDEGKVPHQATNNMAINLLKNEINQDLKQNTIDEKHQELNQNNTRTESMMTETTTTSKTNSGESILQNEKIKSLKTFRRGADSKPSISYSINVNKTAMVKEHLEKYSKRRVNMMGDKIRKVKSDDKQSKDTIKESSKNKKTSIEYKMNISTETNKMINMNRPSKPPPSNTKLTNPSIQTQTLKPKVLKSASFVASKAKRSDNIKLATSDNLPHNSRLNILDSKSNNQPVTNINMLHSEFLPNETSKPLNSSSPHILDLSDIEKNEHKQCEVSTHINKIHESKKLIIDDHNDSTSGYNSQQFSASSTSSPSMYSTIITRRVNKIGATPVKNLHYIKDPRYALTKSRNTNSQFKLNSRQFMTNAGRLRGGEDRINNTLEQLLIRAHSLSRNLQNIRSKCQEYVGQFEKCNFENLSPKLECSCDSIQCTCNGLNFNQNNESKSSPTRKHIPRSSLRKCDYDFQNPCMEGPFSDILARHFLPGNKGKMPAIVGYKTDGIPIYGPPGAAYNVMGWTRDGSPIFGRGGPGSKEPLVNIRGYNKSTPLYEPMDPVEKDKITLIGTYDNMPITGHRDLINGMVFIGKGDKGFGKYKVLTKSQKTASSIQNNSAVTPTMSEIESIDLEEMKRALNSIISNEPAKSMTPDDTSHAINKAKTDKHQGYPLSYNIGNIRCNKYHKKCISSKYRICSLGIYKPVTKKRSPSKPESLKRVSKEQWPHKPGEIMKPVARTIKMHRRRLGLKNPERLLKLDN